MVFYITFNIAYSVQNHIFIELFLLNVIILYKN